MAGFSQTEVYPMKNKFLSSIVLAALTGIVAAGCEAYVATPNGQVAVSGPPPPAQVDIETVAPGPGYIWVGGAWGWGPHNRWEWERGRWDRPPYAGARWHANHYEYRNGRHVYARGGWR